MNHRKRGAVGLAVTALLGATLLGTPVHAIAAQETTQTPQTEADAAAAALASGLYPFGTELMLLNGQADVKNAAGSEAATLTQIDEGTTVTVLAGPEPVGGVDWYQVETEGGITGWVPVDQFGVAQGGVALPAGTEREVIADSLNLRAEPGATSEIISGLAGGDTVTIVSGPETVDDFDWYQVDTAFGEQGWLAGVYLGPIGGATASGATDPETTAAATGAQTAETPEATATADATAQTDVTANAAAIATVAFPTGSYVFIAGDGESVNLRADASTDSEIVSQLSDGAVGIVDDAPVLGGDYDWYPVSFSDGETTLTGFVAGDFLTGGITVGAAAEVADGPLNLRPAASTEGEPLAQLETGTQVSVVSGPTEDADGNAWFEITAGDLTGFVAGQFLGAPTA